METIVLLATAWGSRFGGVNSFNMDLSRALGAQLVGRVRVVCVVAEASQEEIEDAHRYGVELVVIPLPGPVASFDESHAPLIGTLVRAADKDASHRVTWWIGHDLITGPAAVALPLTTNEGSSVVINHMSYIDYAAYKHGVGVIAQQKSDDQKKLFERAGISIAVGPLLRNRLADMMLCAPSDVRMLVPGLADIEPAPTPSTLSAIAFGRLDPANDRVKQGRLAVAAFATASAHSRGPGLPQSLLYARMTVLGLDQAGGKEEEDLLALAQNRAKRSVPLIVLPYSEDRRAVHEQLRRSSVAMMLSWHEGFGLTGWEAIAAAVPLILSRNSGLHMFLSERLGGAGLGCVRVVDIQGRTGADGEDSFTEVDENSVRDALLDIAADPGTWKGNATRLRSQLVEGTSACTWQNAALKVVEWLGLEGAQLVNAGGRASWPLARTPAAKADDDVLSPRDLVHLPGPRWNAGNAESVLLRPEELCVPFHVSRQSLLDELVGWGISEGASRVKVRLLVGPGGAGKTRLLLEACHLLRARGWRTGFLASDSHLSLAMAQQIVRHAAPQLIVLDYSETRSPDAVLLATAALSRDLAHSLRVVLLAREAGEWWDRLLSDRAFEDLATQRALGGPDRVPPIGTSSEERAGIFLSALTAFAERLALPHEHILPPNLTAPHFGDVLFIHLSALSALAGERPESATALLEATLRRERRYWHYAAVANGIPQDSVSSVDQGMALLTLVGGLRSALATRSLIQQAPRIRDLGAEQRELVLQVLRAFYPLEGGVDGLRPDILGERLVAHELGKDDELIDVVAGPGADREQARASLTALAFLARRTPADAAWLQRAVHRAFPARVDDLVDTAIRTGDPIGRLLAAELEAATPDTQQSVSEAVHAQLPDSSITLLEFALIVAQLRVDRLKRLGTKGDRRKAQLGAALTRLGNRLGDVGRYEESLECHQQGLLLSRSLSRHGSPIGVANYATDHDNIATCLTALGRYEEALAEAEVGLRLRRKLAGTKDDRFRANLRVALGNYSGILERLGRFDAALASANEALRIARLLDRRTPSTFRADLSSALARLSDVLGRLGRYEEALALAEESALIVRALVEDRPDAHRAGLATTLGTLSNRLRDIGRDDLALSNAMEACEVIRDLAESRPDSFNRLYVVGLVNLANLLGELGKHSEALPLASSAVQLQRRLVEDQPSEGRANLGAALNGLGIHLRNVGGYDGALSCSEEAVGIYQALSESRPQAHLADLAMGYGNLAVILTDLDRRDEAFAITGKSVKISRSLVETRPEAHRDRLAIVLGNYAYLAADLGQFEEGRSAAEEASHLWQPSLESRPRVVRAYVASGLCALSRCLEGLGSFDDARRTATAALDLLSTDLGVRPRQLDSRARDVARHLHRIANVEVDQALFGSLTGQVANSDAAHQDHAAPRYS